jgi:acyl-CoA thioester hydrolase
VNNDNHPAGTAATIARPAPSERSAYKEFRTLTTRWMDNDAYGHMNNVVHYSLFDTAVNGWLIEQGVLDFVAGEQIGLVVETGCRYFSELAFPDNVTAGLRVPKLGASSVRYEIGLFRNDEASAAAEGFFIHVYVDRLTRRPTPLNGALRSALERLVI